MGEFSRGRRDRGRRRGGRRAARFPGPDRARRKRKDLTNGLQPAGARVPSGPGRAAFCVYSGIMRPARLLARLLGVVAALPAIRAQPASAAASAATGPCATPDSVAFRGLSRIPEGDAPGGRRDRSKVHDQRADRRPGHSSDLYATNQFEANVTAVCEIIGGKSVLVFNAQGAPVLSDVQVVGAGKVSRQFGEGSGRPPDRQADRPGAGREGRRPHRLALPVRGLLPRQSRRRRTRRQGRSTTTTLVFRVDEGRRSRSRASRSRATRRFRRSTIVGAMSTQPEGFFWWSKGEFDSGQVRRRSRRRTIPALYASHGFIDMQVVKDTLIVDREQRQRRWCGSR